MWVGVVKCVSVMINGDEVWDKLGRSATASQGVSIDVFPSA